jgi:hypothetical protein
LGGRKITSNALTWVEKWVENGPAFAPGRMC